MNSVLFEISVCAILTAVIKALIPSEKYSKQIKTLIACFFVITVMNAVSGELNLDDFSEIIETQGGYNDYTSEYSGKVAEETAKEVETAISGQLSRQGIFPEKIYVTVNITDSGSISISEIKLVFGKGQESVSGRAVEITEKCLGSGTVVTAEESCE